MKFMILLCFTLSFMLWIGCATSGFGWKSEAPDEQPKAADEVAFVEDFDPLTLTDEEIVVPRRTQDTRTPAEDTEEAIEVIEGGLPDEALVDGYRVQLFASKNQEAAHTEKRRIMMRITDHKVYLPYLQSMYRLRVGDFFTRTSAQAYADELRRRGMDAFVARDRIDPRRAPDKP